MKHMLFWMLWYLSICWPHSGVAEAQTPQTKMVSNIVRARIGIEVQKASEERLAKGFERVSPHAKYRIYAIPEPDPGYLYVVYADETTATLLNQSAQIQVSKDDLLILPSEHELYAIDEHSATIAFTILCSATRLADVEMLFERGECPIAEWLSLEQELIMQSEIDLSKAPSEPWPLAGTIRGNEVIETLKISSGKSWVVKKYEFCIEK